MKKHHIYQVLVGSVLLAVIPLIFARQSSDSLEIAQSLAERGVITYRHDSDAYEFSKVTPLKEIAAIALNLQQSQSPGLILNSADIDPADWPQAIVQRARDNGILPDTFSSDPDGAISRVLAYAVIMNSVCMAPSSIGYDSWGQSIHANAYENGLTTLLWHEFDPDASILREEIFVIAKRVLDWVDMTGGCQPYHTNSLPFAQEPGTFVLRFVTVTDDVMSYVAYQDDTPDSIKYRYVSSKGLSYDTTESLTVVNSEGIEVSDTFLFLANDLVYIYHPRSDPIPDSYFIGMSVAFGQEPGTFVQRFETVDSLIYSYIVRTGGNPDAIRTRYASVFSRSFDKSIGISDESGIDIAEDASLQAGQLVYVYVAKE